MTDMTAEQALMAQLETWARLKASIIKLRKGESEMNIKKLVVIVTAALIISGCGEVEQTGKYQSKSLRKILAQTLFVCLGRWMY